MADIPIIFSAPMVRALLEGRKTQTRRILGKRSSPRSPNIFDGTWTDDYVLDPGNASWRERCVPYAPGDRLYVREAWQSNGLNWGKKPRDMRHGLGPVHYAATDAGEWKTYWGNWKPSIHMPRWASRLTLTVTDVRVQRLQEISEEEAEAEGCEASGWRPTYANPDNAGCEQSTSARDAFCDLWNKLHGHDAWDANPWVVALTFTVQHGNIDHIGAAT